MRTITKELIVYNHTDLIMPENAKVLEAVKEAMQFNLNENYESIADNEITHFKERLESEGFSKIDVRYSGFWSQGDGASFTAYCDSTKLIAKHFPANTPKQFKKMILQGLGGTISFEICRQIWGGYVHDNLMNVDVSLDNSIELSEEQKPLLQDLVSSLLEYAQQQARDLYRSLENNHEYVHSDAYLLEEIQNCDYEFFENGKLVS